ncbi:MAG: hypothetical protein EOO77_34570 [Oxalobacteraceae bacterium]|nr:MAG: hypothetical protein EOO77_34570 [Oxalobacteraceae bacterium]
MTNGSSISTVERAFQLARTGACHSEVEIRQRLNAEGYDGVHGHLNGSTIQRQLRDVLAARGVSHGADDDAGSDE